MNNLKTYAQLQHRISHLQHEDEGSPTLYRVMYRQREGPSRVSSGEHASETMRPPVTLSMGIKWSSRVTAPEQEHVISIPPGFTTRMACMAGSPSHNWIPAGGRQEEGYQIDHFYCSACRLLHVHQHLVRMPSRRHKCSEATLVVMKPDARQIRHNCELSCALHWTLELQHSLARGRISDLGGVSHRF